MTAHWIEIRGGCTQHRMYASPSDNWRLTGVGGIHWPPRWVLKCFKYAAAISPMLNGFCSPCGSDFQSVSVCIAMNKPCVPKTSDYLIFCLFAQWLFVWPETDWKCSLRTWPLLLLSAIVLQIWGRRSTTLFYGIGLFECYLIHNVVTASFAALENSVHNPIQTEARECKQVLERW